MKKLVCVIMALAMMLSMSVMVFAEEDVGGDLFRAYFNGKDGVTGDLLDLYFKEELKIELYDAENNLITYKVYNGTAGKYDEITFTFSYEPEYREGSWKHQAYTPTDDVVPAYVVLKLDGNEVDRHAVTESADSNNALSAEMWADAEFTEAKPVVKPTPEPDTIVIDINGAVNTESEENPNTGAPVMIPVAAVLVVLSGAVIFKRK